MTRCRLWKRNLWFLAFIVLASAIPSQAAGGAREDRALVLRVSTVEARPGGQLAIVLRTYAMRPIRQGRIKVTTSSASTVASIQAVEARRRAPRSAAAASTGGGLHFVGAEVFSAADDTVASVSLATTATDTSVTIDFSSPSASVNSSSGPLAVLFFTVDAAALPGAQYAVRVDRERTSLIDAAGATVSVAPRNGALTLVAPGDPTTLEADGDKAPPGGNAVVGLGTLESLALSSGRITLLYDDRLAAGPPVVTIDPRHGNVTFIAERSAGRVLVDFVSLDGSFGRVPGSLVSVALPIAADAVPGSQAAVWIDPANTYFLDAAQRPVPLTFEDGLIVVR